MCYNKHIKQRFRAERLRRSKLRRANNQSLKVRTVIFLKKSLNAQLDAVILADFKQKCQNMGLSMTIVLEAFMRDFSNNDTYIITITSSGATMQHKQQSDTTEWHKATQKIEQKKDTSVTRKSTRLHLNTNITIVMCQKIRPTGRA